MNETYRNLLLLYIPDTGGGAPAVEESHLLMLGIT